MVAATGKRIHELTAAMHAEFGPFFSKRIDVKLTPRLKESLARKLANPPQELDGLKVETVNRTDGVKLLFNNGKWVLFRLSGTEPVARMYAEACSPKDLMNLIRAGRRYVMSEN